MGDLAQDVASVLMLVAWFSLKIKKREEVMIMYIRRARRVREGANCRMRSIQPRWAIDE